MAWGTLKTDHGGERRTRCETAMFNSSPAFFVGVLQNRQVNFPQKHLWFRWKSSNFSQNTHICFLWIGLPKGKILMEGRNKRNPTGEIGLIWSNSFSRSKFLWMFHQSVLFTPHCCYEVLWEYVSEQAVSCSSKAKRWSRHCSFIMLYFWPFEDWKVSTSLSLHQKRNFSLSWLTEAASQGKTEK